MRLRTRILFGYWYLVILLIISAVGAALGFHRLGDNIGRVLTENFDSIHASISMTESLERQDSAVLAVLLGKDGAREQLESSETTFSEALARARSNITIKEEVEVIDDIERRFAAFTAARDELLDAPPEYPLRAYEDETFPRFEEVKGRVLDLLELNYQAMVEADRHAQSTALRRASTLALLVLVALFSLAFLSRSMNRDVLVRLDELAEVAEAIAAGGIHRRASAERPDELGVVARQLNAVLDRLQEVRGAGDGRVALYRELLVGLMGALPGPSAVLDLDGGVLASTFDEDVEVQLAAAGARLPRPDEGHSEPVRVFELDSGAVQLKLLRDATAKPVGWLAIFPEAF